MSDMHDGIGAQLISTLGMAEHGQLSSEEMATALRECLDDLRLTIDSLEPLDNLRHWPWHGFACVNAEARMANGCFELR